MCYRVGANETSQDARSGRLRGIYLGEEGGAKTRRCAGRQNAGLRRGYLRKVEAYFAKRAARLDRPLLFYRSPLRPNQLISVGLIVVVFVGKTPKRRATSV